MWIPLNFHFYIFISLNFNFTPPYDFVHSNVTRHFCMRSYFVIKHSYVIIKFWQWWILIIYKRLKNVRKYRTALVHMCMNCFDDIWWLIFVHSYLKAMLKWILQLFWWSNRGEKTWVKVKVDEVVKVKITFFFSEGLLFVSAQKTLFIYVHLNKIKCIHFNWHIFDWPILTHHHN